MKNKRYKKYQVDKEKVKKLILYLLLFAVSLTVLILELTFRFLPNGVISVSVCVVCIATMLFSVLNFCRLSPDPMESFGYIFELILDFIFS